MSSVEARRTPIERAGLLLLGHHFEEHPRYVIGHLEALPEPIQIALGFASFRIGDEHFYWGIDQIKNWHKERCRSLRQQLSELERERWRSPVGALPSQFGAPQYS
jgi:hypothetical protein